MSMRLQFKKLEVENKRPSYFTLQCCQWLNFYKGLTIATENFKNYVTTLLWKVVSRSIGCISMSCLLLVVVHSLNLYLCRNLQYLSIFFADLIHHLLPSIFFAPDSPFFFPELPASQAAASKFCNGFAACAPDSGDAFWRSSNSARSSGSTGAWYVSGN